MNAPDVTDRQRALLREADRLWWWHRISLGDYTTRGHGNRQLQEWLTSELPATFAGLSVLDVGAADGVFSFEAERRGAAKVLAIDSFQGRGGTWPHAGDADLRTFQLARDFLASSVEYRILPLEALDESPQAFDVILCFGVYYHTKVPERVLGILAKHLAPGGLLLLEGMVRAGQEASLYRFPPGSIEPTTYFAGTLSWIVSTLEAAGVRLQGDPVVKILGPPIVRQLARLSWRLGWNPYRVRELYRALFRFKKDLPHQV